MVVYELLTIVTLIVTLTDLSGWTSTPKKLFWRWLYKNRPYKEFSWEDIHPMLKILECSLCQSFWTGLIFIIATNQFSLFNLALVLGLSYFSSVIKDILILIKDLLVKINNKIYEWLGL